MSSQRAKQLLSTDASNIYIYIYIYTINFNKSFNLYIGRFFIFNAFVLVLIVFWGFLIYLG